MRIANLLFFFFSLASLWGQDMVDLYHQIPTNWLPVKYDLSVYRPSNTFEIPNRFKESTPPVRGLLDLKNWYLELSETLMGSGSVLTDQFARFGNARSGLLIGINRAEWGAMPSSRLIFLRAEGHSFVEVTTDIFPKIDVSDFRTDRARLTGIPWALEMLQKPTLVYKLPHFGTTIEVTGHMTGGYAMARMNAFEKPDAEKRVVEKYLEGVDLSTLYFGWFPNENRFRLTSRQ